MRCPFVTWRHSSDQSWMSSLGRGIRTNWCSNNLRGKNARCISDYYDRCLKSFHGRKNHRLLHAQQRYSKTNDWKNKLPLVHRNVKLQQSTVNNVHLIIPWNSKIYYLFPVWHRSCSSDWPNVASLQLQHQNWRMWFSRLCQYATEGSRQVGW